MDKLKHYQAAIRKVLSEYAAFLQSSPDLNYKVAILFDDEQWIEEDMTEDGIATALLEQGIPKRDIVLGFQPPYIRE